MNAPIGNTERRSSVTEHRVEVRVEVVDWASWEPAIRAIREAVFMVEQGVPEELEWDGIDASCAHVLAWSNHGEAIGTARMQSDGKIGRMAVLKNWRGSGVGEALLQTLLNLAEKQSLSRVTLAAQTHAVGFYERAGFHVVGDQFMDAGIPHRMMVRELLLPQADPERR
jgi:predicted GNAT family N-acyltransferase